MKRKKKVFVYIHQCILTGGVEMVFNRILNHLPAEEYDITILSVMGYLKDDFDAPLFRPGIKRHCMMWDELSKTNPLRRITQKLHNRLFPPLYKFLLRFRKYDIAIAAQEGAYADFVTDHVRADRKFLWIHNDMSVCHWTLQHFGSAEREEECYRRFTRVICVSDKVRQSMAGLFPQLSNLCVAYNPIDTGHIDECLTAPRPARPDAVGPWFVCVGRLADQKGFDRLIRVCHRLQKEGHEFHVTVLGGGADWQKLEQMLSELHVTNISFLGHKSNPFPYIKAADWFLLPSRFEGFPLVLCEAAYCKTPILTTDVAGAKELLGESEYGIVTENSEEGIYRAMKSVLTDQIQHEKYKTAIKKRSGFVNLQNRISAIRAILDSVTICK